MIISNLSHMETIAQETEIQGMGHKYKYPKYHKPIVAPAPKYPKYKVPSFAFAATFAVAFSSGEGAAAAASSTAVATTA